MNNSYDETKAGLANKNYRCLCGTLDKMNWKYTRQDDARKITTSAVGKDLTIALNFFVDAERQVMYVKSPLPFTIAEKRRDEVEKALHAANYSMLNGCFEYNDKNGYVAFRIVIPFEGCEVSQEMCKYMVALTCQMVDKFNDKILALSEGRMTLKQFLQFAES